MSKTITRKSNNVSVFVLHDDATVDLAATPNATVRGNTGGKVDFDIGDMNSGNATLHTDVTAPADWQGNRYEFDGTTWTEVAGWVDPKVAEIARLQGQIDALNAA
tara:strand:- start:10 stop:324 length:315 start_codon:yes stop_codon:yes gene_type:complete